MQNFSLISQWLRLNPACTKFGVMKCKIDPIFSAMAAEKGHCASCTPFYHHPLLIAFLKLKTKPKFIKFWENGEIEMFLALKFNVNA